MNKIIHGDSKEKLKELDDNSVDLIVTDPPFGIGFMGKAWDTFKPGEVKKNVKKSEESFQHNKDRKQDNPNIRGRKNSPVVSRAEHAGTYDHSPSANQAFQKFIYDVCVELLRVLKPGGFMFMCMTPRQDCMSRCMVAIEDAGFNTGFTSMYWTYATGFCKCLNIKKKMLKDITKLMEEQGIENIEWEDK